MKQHQLPHHTGKPFLRLRTAFARGNSESSFDVQAIQPAKKELTPSNVGEPVTETKAVSFRLDLNEEYTDTKEPRNYEECRRCFVNRDDYQAFARDSALCIESYRRTAQQGKEWTDEDGVSSVRGLEEFTTRINHHRSSAAICYSTHTTASCFEGAREIETTIDEQ
ncbi:hypothetical protein MPSEU_001028700 [Mayamaea pseudoterrestris]|nr:hypothetical protein MPSEU_001028700 [Mayamaea pseudoterrestris]